MALILPRSYHKIAAVEKNRISWIEPELAERQDIRPLRIGILNIMPLGKQYEFNLLHPLGLSPLQIEPIWIRLNSHAYKTWDLDHLEKLYLSWEDAMADGVNRLLNIDALKGLKHFRSFFRQTEPGA